MLLIVAAGIHACGGECWSPGVIYRNLCREAENNTAIARRRLLWHGGGAAYLDEPDHALGDNKRYRGDGGTLHDSDLDGGITFGERELHPACPLSFPHPNCTTADTLWNRPLFLLLAAGTPDLGLVKSSALEDAFMSFVEARADSGNTEIYGREDLWYQDLFKCEPDNPALRLCETCGNHCRSFDIDSGYSILNGTELEIEELYWSECPTPAPPSKQPQVTRSDAKNPQKTSCIP